jgi:hypothetical protein
MVVGVGPEEQVTVGILLVRLGADAGRVIAVVADEHPIRDWTVGEFIGNAVRQEDFVVDAQDAITSPVSTTRPLVAARL